MIDVIKFLFEYTIKFLSMLFTIDVGNGINLGTMMCIVFIFLPTVLFVVNFLKASLIDELDDRYDRDRFKVKQKEGRTFFFKREEPVYVFDKKYKRNKFVLKKKSSFPKSRY